MNKRLEELLERVAHWPPGAQADVVATIEGIEATLVANSGLAPEEQEAKLAALRAMVRKSIAEGGSYTDEEVGASIAAALDARDRERTNSGA
jgi:hypothetical protein